MPRSVDEAFLHVGGLARAQQLTKDEEGEVWEEAFQGRNYLICMEREGERRDMYCTRERQWITLGHRSQHGEERVCPSCGERVRVVHNWRRTNSTMDKAVVYLWRRSVLRPGVVCCLCLYIERWWPWQRMERPEEISLECLLDSLAVYAPGEGGMMIRPKGGGRIHNYIRWDLRGREQKTAYMVSSTGPSPRHSLYGSQNPYNYYRDTQTGDYLYASEDSLYKAVEGSPLSYGLEEYMRYGDDFAIRWMDRAARYSAYEKLLKIGFAPLIGWHLGDRNRGLPMINWRGKTLTAILKKPLLKEDKEWLRDEDNQYKLIDYDGRYLTLWQKTDMGLRETIELAQDIGTPMMILALLIKADFTLTRLRDYFARQRERAKADGRGEPRLADLRDYWQDCEKLGLDLSRRRIKWPQNLTKEHERTYKLVQEKAQQIQEEGYRQRRESLQQWMSYENEEFQIQIPEQLSELTAEGLAMHHCVGTYIRRVADGQTNVVFLRRKEDLKTPFVTIEVGNDGRIIQARAKYNHEPPPEAKTFVDAFAEEIKMRRRKSA